MQGPVEALDFISISNLHRRDPVDQPEHSVREDESPRRGDGYGRNLHQKEVRVSAQEAVDAGRIERRRGEDAAKDDAEEAAYSVNAPDVERVVPLQLVFQRHGVKANDAGDESDQTGSGWRDISRCRRDSSESGDRAGQ